MRTLFKRKHTSKAKMSRAEYIETYYPGWKALGKYDAYKIGTDFAIIDQGGYFDIVKKSTLGKRGRPVKNTYLYDLSGSFSAAVKKVEHMCEIIEMDKKLVLLNQCVEKTSS